MSEDARPRTGDLVVRSSCECGWGYTEIVPRQAVTPQRAEYEVRDMEQLTNDHRKECAAGKGETVAVRTFVEQDWLADSGGATAHPTLQALADDVSQEKPQ